MDHHYHCEAYQPEDEDNGDQEEGGLAISFLCIEFFVSIDGFIKHGNLTLSIDEPTTTTTTTTSLSWSVVISGKLSELHVPYDSHMSLIMTITNCARSIINEDRNNNNNNNNNSCHVIPMVVMITDAAADTSSECCCSIQEALEKTRVEDCSRQCVICLEEISVGSEATRMPCSHVYHQDCIVTWLKQSNLCPLCRFQMPVKSFLHS